MSGSGMTRERENKNGGDAWLAKMSAMAIPPLVLEYMVPRQPHVAFAGGILLGVFLQYLIPPRGTVRRLGLLVLIAIALALLNWYVF
jgi:hypothetical protein